MFPILRQGEVARCIATVRCLIEVQNKLQPLYTGGGGGFKNRYTLMKYNIEEE